MHLDYIKIHVIIHYLANYCIHMCCCLYCVIAVEWASTGNPVNPAPCTILTSVLLGALLSHISHDLGLLTGISHIYSDDMRTAAMTNVMRHY